MPGRKVRTADARSLNAWRLNLQRVDLDVAAKPLQLVELVPTPARSRVCVSCGPFVVEVEPDHDDGQIRRVLPLVATCSG